MQTRKRARRGLTLIEIMVVLVILGLMASAIGYNVFEVKRTAEVDDARLNVTKLREAVELYRLRHPTLPESLAVLEGREIRRLTPDPWGTPYTYSHDGDRFEIVSLGPDRIVSPDDVREDAGR